MKLRLVLPALTMLLVGVTRSGAAQTVELTVKVPVILTQLAPENRYVKVWCNVISDALITNNASYPNSVRKDEDVPVVGGEVVKVVTLVYTLTLQNPLGKPASVACLVEGWDATTGSWKPFNETATNPALRTKPSLFAISSSFVW